MKRLILLVVALLLVVGCQPAIRYSSKPPNPRTAGGLGYPEPEPEKPYEPVERQSAVDVARLSSIVEDYVGTKYRSGGYGKLGVDCSGLVYAVYRDYGNIHLPPNTKKLYTQLPRVSYREIQYGDLVFFSLEGKHASHVGIYVGDDKFVHASRSQGVICSSLTEEYYLSAYVGARRVIGS